MDWKYPFSDCNCGSSLSPPSPCLLCHFCLLCLVCLCFFCFLFLLCLFCSVFSIILTLEYAKSVTFSFLFLFHLSPSSFSFIFLFHLSLSSFSVKLAVWAVSLHFLHDFTLYITNNRLCSFHFSDTIWPLSLSSNFGTQRSCLTQDTDCMSKWQDRTGVLSLINIKDWDMSMARVGKAIRIVWEPPSMPFALLL